VKRGDPRHKHIINSAPRGPTLSRAELLGWYALLDAALDQPNPTPALRAAITQLAAARRQDDTT